jgi:hypothetical protein
MPAGLAHFKSYLAVYCLCKHFVRLNAFNLCYGTKANASSLIFNLKNVSCLQILVTETLYFSKSTTKVHVCRHFNFIEDKFPARAFPGQSEHVVNIPTSSSKVGMSSTQIPDQAREPDSDNIPTLMDDLESKYSVSDDDSENHDIPDLADDHEGADDT